MITHEIDRICYTFLIKLNKTIYIVLLCFLSHIAVAQTNNTLIEINIQIKNIATDKDNEPESLGEGLSFISKEMQVSSREIPDIDKVFDRKALKKFKEIKKQIVSGRTAIIDYNLTNFEFNIDSRIKNCKCNGQGTENTEQYDCNCFRLFNIGCFIYRFDYAIKHKDGKWVTTSLLPNSFYFDPPRPATVVGVGDINLVIPGLSLNNNPTLNLAQLEQFYISDSIKIAVTRQPFDKQFILIPDDNIVPRLTSPEAKFEVKGKANIGESAILTIRSPFWYPFDKYVFNFLTLTYFDSYLKINFNSIEDLDLETKEQLDIKSRKNEIKSFKFNLYRKYNFLTLILPFILSLAPLFNFFKEKRIFRVRFVTYLISVSGIYLSLPKAINVPIVNILTISLSVIFLVLFCSIEKKMFTKVFRKFSLLYNSIVSR